MDDKAWKVNQAQSDNLLPTDSLLAVLGLWTSDLFAVTSCLISLVLGDRSIELQYVHLVSDALSGCFKHEVSSSGSNLATHVFLFQYQQI